MGLGLQAERKSAQSAFVRKMRASSDSEAARDVALLYVECLVRVAQAGASSKRFRSSDVGKALEDFAPQVRQTAAHPGATLRCVPLEKLPRRALRCQALVCVARVCTHGVF